MKRRTIQLLSVVPLALVGTAISVPLASTNICPICGGGWDDYWNLVRSLVSVGVGVARFLVGV